MKPCNAYCFQRNMTCIPVKYQHDSEMELNGVKRPARKTLVYL